MFDPTRRRAGSNPIQEGFNLAQQALVNLNGDNVVTAAGAVTEMTNIGTGGAAYDLDVVAGTGANLKPHPSGSCLLYGASGDYLSTPNAVANQITGNIDIRGDLTLDDWTSGTTQMIVAKDVTTQRAYRLGVTSTGTLELGVSASAGNITFVYSTVGVGFADGTRHWVRATVDVDNGASGWDATFYTSEDGIAWTQLGDVVTTATAIAITAATSNVQIGALNVTQQRVLGSVHTVKVYNGIDGTLAVDFNAADAGNLGATSFASSTTGETWTLNGNTFIQNTGHQVVHSIGSAGLESTAAQTIANVGTVFATARSSIDPTTAQRHIFDAKIGASRWVGFAATTSGAPSIHQGTTVNLSEALDAAAHVWTFQFNAGATSKLTVSDIGTATGDAGSLGWDYATLFAGLSGANTWVGYIGELIVFDYALSDSEVASVQAYLASSNAI